MNEDNYINGYKNGTRDTLSRVFDCIANSFEDGKKQLIHKVVHLLVVEQIDKRIPVEKRRENIQKIIDKELDNWIK